MCRSERQRKNVALTRAMSRKKLPPLPTAALLPGRNCVALPARLPAANLPRESWSPPSNGDGNGGDGGFPLVVWPFRDAIANLRLGSVGTGRLGHCNLS